LIVLSTAERLLLESRADPDALAAVLWSAKESAFKAWSAAMGGLPDVDPIEIEVALEPEALLRLDSAASETTSTFVVQAAGALAGRVAPVGLLKGTLHVAQGWVFTLVVATR
jgi:4'-phosphopantetheinyl transferase EntD